MGQNTGQAHLNIMQINMNNLDIYTSTGEKYSRHPDMINALRNGVGRPQSLQVALTNRCNLKCVFCSVAERELKQEWDYEELLKAIEAFIACGIKTIEFSGGGEPTLHPDFWGFVLHARRKGLKMGLITNGLRLKDFQHDSLALFDWIRISMVALDYQETIELPDRFPDNVTIGMSYVVGQKEYQGKRTHWQSDYGQLMKIREYAIKYNAKFVRIVPECFSDETEMNEMHEHYKNVITPFLFQPKRQKQAEHCWMDAVKPWLHVDGYVYPCNSVSLNTHANRDFHPGWRTCHWKHIRQYYNEYKDSYIKVAHLCDRCTFTQNNDVIKDLLNPIEHEEFV